jgi:uncharacterized hydrophobic protein (TIGR00271 family)
MRLRTRIEHLLGITSATKPQVYLRLYEAAEYASLNYVLELLLSAGIASLGLVLNSPAVVIGAMLISPMMGPILATGLALAASDVYLGIKCLINILMSIAGAVLFSAFLVWILPFHSPTTEILARTQPNLLDLGVALFSGLAGSLVVCRGGGGGGVTALPGVAIAVALMPPLCTVGFGIGSGMDWSIISGASLLFVTNLAAIVACALLIFVLARMHAPDVRTSIGSSEMERAATDRLYAILHKTRLARSFGEVGHLRWRVLMLIVALAVLFVPLKRALNQVRDETISRSAVRDALRLLGPSDAFLTQELDILPDRVLVHLVVATSIPVDKLQSAERLIIQRTGKAAAITVRQVASQEELAVLRERLSQPPPPPPPAPRDLESIRKDLMSRIRGPLQEAWPADFAPLQGYQLGFTPDGIVVTLRYESRKTLDPATGEVLTRVLKTSLKTENLRLELERVPPSPRPRAAKSAAVKRVTGKPVPAKTAPAKPVPAKIPARSAGATGGGSQPQ